MSMLSSNLGHHSTTVVKTQTEKVISILRWTFGLLPITTGTDKFFHIITNWDKYLSPLVPSTTDIPRHTFMNITGVVEILAGLLVLVRPRFGSFVVGLWLVGITVNLLVTKEYLDIALRDTVMAISAFCLFILTGHDRN